MNNKVSKRRVTGTVMCTLPVHGMGASLISVSPTKDMVVWESGTGHKVREERWARCWMKSKVRKED